MLQFLRPTVGAVARCGGAFVERRGDISVYISGSVLVFDPLYLLCCKSRGQASQIPLPDFLGPFFIVWQCIVAYFQVTYLLVDKGYRPISSTDTAPNIH